MNLDPYHCIKIIFIVLLYKKVGGLSMLPESSYLPDYLEESDIIDFSNPLIERKCNHLFDRPSSSSELKKVKIAFEFVRDEIPHSWDIQGSVVTCSASEVLKHQQGICYAKSHLLAAILRRVGIPTGFCYQKLMLFDTPDKGYAIHALNGIYLHSLEKWIRLDARGNKPGVKAEFSLTEEKLAFPIQEQYGERDYQTIFTKPNQKTITTLKDNSNVIEMYKNKLPDEL